MRQFLLSTVGICFLVAGCAGRQEVATLAGQSSAVMNDYKREMTGFARDQTSLSQDNARRIAAFAQMRERLQMDIDRRLIGWQLVDESAALAMYAEATRDGADQILARSETLRAAASPSSQVATVKFDAAQVEAVIKQLKALERSPTFWDKLVFAVSYNDDLRAAYKKSLEEAGTASDNAETAAVSATEAITTPTP